MRISSFKIEDYFAKYEFSVEYLLSASDCEAFSMEEIVAGADEEGRKLWKDLRLGYTETQGHPLLREEISRLYGTTKPEDVVEAVPEEAIFVAMNVLLEPGDSVVAVSPAYQSLYEIARAIGCEVTPWPLRLEGGAWKADLDLLERLVTPRTKLVVVNFPHNPTGFLPTEAEYRRIVEIARKNGAWLFSDEMYRWLEHDDKDLLPAGVDAYEKGISLGGLSKTFGLPGLRVGWLACRNAEFLRDVVGTKYYTSICSSAPSEILGILALRQRERLRARSLEIVRENQRLAERFFGDRADLFEWIPPRAGSVAFPKLRLDTPVLDFCEKTVAESNVMILPGDMFEVPGNHFRVGLGRRNFADALGRFGAYLAENRR